MEETPATQDRYPSLDKVIDEVFDAEDFPEGPIERFEITCLASGDATYRVWPARAEEPESGYFAEADLS